MQRGRGRGRGRNPNPAQSNSRRGDRATNSNTPQSHQSQSRNTRNTLRRSARIAELLNGDLDQLDPSSNSSSHQQPSNSSMADVARPRALGNRSVRSRHHSGNTRTPGRSRSGRHSLSPEDIRYAMDIVVQPPRTARAGQTLTGSIIVRLRTTNADADEAIADSTNLVAVATLVPGPNSTAPSDPQVLNALLAGRRFDSIHPFTDDEADGSIASMDMADPRGVGYMRFPELIIRQAGTYRIRITLIRIPNSPSHPPVASTGGGASVQIVDSNPIIVQASGPTSNMAAYNEDEDAEDDGGWLEVLRSIQERRRSR